MAKTLYSQSGKIEYGIKKYTVDTEADKEALNLRTTKMGSKCYVIDTKKWYILNSSNQWVPFVDAGGSGGSGSPFNIKSSVATINDLPTEDNEIGDLYIVQEDHGEWVWLTSSEEPNGYWEQLGVEITADAVASAIDDMTSTQTAQLRSDLGAEPKKFVITVTHDNGNDEYTADKTFTEIQEAYEAGKTLVVNYDYYWYTLLRFERGDNAAFVTCSYNEDEHGKIIYVERFEIKYDDSVDFAYTESPSIPTIITDLSSTSVTLVPQSNTVYHCGELTSLTINNPPANGAYSIVFTSGATATTTTFPATILGLEDFAPEANTLYEINVLDNRAVVGSWGVSV